MRISVPCHVGKTSIALREIWEPNVCNLKKEERPLPPTPSPYTHPSPLHQHCDQPHVKTTKWRPWPQSPSSYYNWSEGTYFCLEGDSCAMSVTRGRYDLCRGCGTRPIYTCALRVTQSCYLCFECGTRRYEGDTCATYVGEGEIRGRMQEVCHETITRNLGGLLPVKVVCYARDQC